MRQPSLYVDSGTEEEESERDDLLSSSAIIRKTYQDRLNEAIEASAIMQRKHDEEAAEAEAMRKLRLSLYVRFIGDSTQQERAYLFQKAVRSKETSISGQPLFGNRWYQSPYNSNTWRNKEELERVTTANRKISPLDDVGARRAQFNNYYSETGRSQKIQSYSNPEIFILRATALNSLALKEVLYGGDMLLMKMTPLERAAHDELTLKQTYNEIRIQYFLNELLYGYSNVLSIHFVVLIDWFQTSRSNLALQPTTDVLYNQVVISEYAETDFFEYLIGNASLDTLRVVMFQVFHALEIAWHTNRFIHYDLHAGNLRMRSSNYIDSPFYGRNLLYARKDMPHWYALDQRHLANHTVKIIDFGFSRMNAPSIPCTVDSHAHDQAIGLDWPIADMVIDRPNRYADVRMFLLSLLGLPLLFWVNLPLADRDVFYAFVEDMLDFNEINRRVSLFNRTAIERDMRIGVPLTAANIASCPTCLEYSRIFGSYARQYSENGRTVSDALDHPFFMSLKRLPGDATTDPVEDVVVSFPTGESVVEDEDPMRTSLGTLLRCRVCERADKEAEHYNLEDGVPIPLCSELCAEFRYLYKGKTVYR